MHQDSVESDEMYVKTDRSEDQKRKTMCIENYILSPGAPTFEDYNNQRKTYAEMSARKTNGFVPARATATDFHKMKIPDDHIESV